MTAFRVVPDLRRRVPLREVARRTGRSMRRLRVLCDEGFFRSAKKDQPRHGWSLSECCVRAEVEKEWPCVVCSEAAERQPIAKRA